MPAKRDSARSGDLLKYVEKRKTKDSEFASGYESGFEEFRIGLLIKELRLKEGMTQEELADKMHTKKVLFHEWKIIQKIFVYQH